METGKKNSPKIAAPVMFAASRNLVEIQELSQFSGESHAHSHISSREKGGGHFENLNIKVPGHPPDAHHHQLSSTLHSNRSVSSKKDLPQKGGRSTKNSSSINSAVEVYLGQPNATARTIASTFDSRQDTKRIKRREMQLSKSGAI